MLEVQAPNQRSLKSRYWKALKTRRSTMRLRQRLFALNQMEQVAIEVVKEDQSIALRLEGLAAERDALAFEQRVSSVEIVVGDGQMANAAVFVVGGRLRRGKRAFRRNNLQHGAIWGFDEVIARVSEIDMEAEVFNVPFGKFLRIRRRDGRVFKSLEHKP